MSSNVRDAKEITQPTDVTENVASDPNDYTSLAV